MSKIIKLGMAFDEDSAPDFGDIEYGRDADLYLTSGSLIKLMDNVTRAVCGNAFNIPVGTRAVVSDTGGVLIYHTDDRWYWFRRPERCYIRYGQLSVSVYNANGSNHILGDNDRIEFGIISGSAAVISKTITLMHYCGSGIYAYWLDQDDAHILSELSDYTFDIKVYQDDTDITDSLTLRYPRTDEWYDTHVKYDNGMG